MEKSQPQKLPGLIRDLRAELRRPDRRPRAQLYELARRRIEAPHEILDDDGLETLRSAPIE